MNLTFIEMLQLASSTGVLSMGLGILRWSMSVERRLTRVETLQEKAA